MKKILLLATLVLGMVSCMKDQSFDANVGGEANVVLSVTLPEDVTRAVDNDSAKGAIGNIDLAQYDIRYILEVFDASKDLAKRVEKYEDSATSTTFELRLIPGRHYSFVVWADFVERNADGDVTMEHYNVADLRNIEIIGAQNAMDESRDAYTGIFRTSDNGGQPFSSSSQISLELKRPFAKLRVVTNDKDEIYSSLVGATIAYTAQTYQKYDALTKVSSKLATVSKSVDYTSDAYLYAGEPTAEGEQTLFADYILGTQSGTVQFTMDVDDSTAETIPTITFNTAIPVKTNYLTTIYGPILTDYNNVTVTINPAFENDGKFEDAPYYQVAVTNGFELVKAFYEGREIVALNDIVVTLADVEAYLATRAGAAINPVINLNGCTITFVNNGGGALLTVAEGSSLTIVDNGDGGAIVVEGTGSAIENNGTLSINNTTLTSNGEGSVIENNANAEVNIEGSTLNEGALENNGEANIADSTLNAGSVENNGTANLNGGDVANDAVENGDDAIVGTYVYTAEELQAAINAAEEGLNNEVSFGDNIEGNITIVQKAGINLIINGRGFEFDGVITVNGAGRSSGTETLTFKVIKFATEGTDFTFINAPSKINGAYNYSHNVTVEDCTFNGNQTVGCIAFTGTYNLVVKDCAATNVHSILQAQSVDNTVLVDGVTVEGSKNGLSFGNTAYPTLKNSTIKASEYGVRADGSASRGALLLEGNTIEANVPVIVRKTTTKYDVTLVNNTITKGGLFEVVFTNGQDDEEYVVPTGTYTITGAEDYMVYPRNSVANWDEFVATTASKVVLLNDITSDANYQLQKDVVIDLNEKSMTLPMINIHKKVTIMNGTINGKVYARKNSEIVFNNVKFSGAVADNLSTEGHLAIQGGCKSLYAKDCLFSPTSVSGSQTKPLSFEGGSTIMKFENCEFKSSPYKKQVYLNSLSATGSLDFTNCNFNNKTPNIMFAATCPLTNLTMSGTTKLGSVTLETNRAKDAVTAEDLAYLRESLIANNSMSSVRLFYAGGSSEYIR